MGNLAPGCQLTKSHFPGAYNQAAKSLLSSWVAVTSRDPTSCKANSLEYLRLRRVAVDRVGQPLKRHLIGNCQRQLADHFTGMRRHERRPHDLAASAARVNRRKPLFFPVDESAFYLRHIDPRRIDRDSIFRGAPWRQADLDPLPILIGAIPNYPLLISS